MNEVSHHLGNDSPSFHPVHSLIRAVGPPDLHHPKGRGAGFKALGAEVGLEHPKELFDDFRLAKSL